MNPIRTTLPGGWRAALWLEDDQQESALREWLTNLTTNPSSLSGYASLKYSASGEVLRADTPPGSTMPQVVCKLSRAWTLGMFLPSRARKNTRRAALLLKAGIRTAQPLAVLERRRESWLITEYLPDLVDLDQFALTILPRLDPFQAHHLKAIVIDQVADVFARLLQGGLHHRDLKASNILLSGTPDVLPSPLAKGGERGVGSPNSTGWPRADTTSEVPNTLDVMRTVILDLDGLRTWTLRRRTAERARLTRLAASLLQYTSITLTDYCRFLRSYLHATHARAGACRELFREIGRSAVAYSSRAQGQKANKLDGYTD